MQRWACMSSPAVAGQLVELDRVAIGIDTASVHEHGSGGGQVRVARCFLQVIQERVKVGGAINVPPVAGCIEVAGELHF